MKFLRFWLLAAALYLAAAIAPPDARASQASGCLPTSGTLSGLSLVNSINSFNDALLTLNSGASAPAPACGSVAKFGTTWLDTNTNSFKVFDGTQWPVLGTFDTVNHYWRPIVGGGTNTLASATTPDLCGTATPSATVSITGTTTITGFGSNCPVGSWKTVVFAGALQLTHNGTSFILPNNGSNITTAAGDTALVVTIAAGQYRFANYIKADGTPLNSTNVTAQALTTSARSFEPINLGLTASVSSNLLTVTLTGENGSAPAANNPLHLPFRDTTLASGAPVWVSATAATSISTFATGATLGSSNNTAFRFWIVALNNAGTIVLGLVNCATSSGVSPIINNEAALVSTTSMTGSATSAGVIYTPNGTTVTTKAFKIIGYLEYGSTGLATAGTYASAPATVMIFGPGVKKPGDIIQTVYVQNGTVANAGANTYAQSSTLPTTGAGIVAASGSVTPTSAANRLRVAAQAIGGVTTNNTGFTGYLYNGTSVVAVSSSAIGANATVLVVSVPLQYEVMPNSASSITYSYYLAGTQTTTYLNGNVTQYFGSVSNSFIRIEEIMSCNDNEAVGLPALPKVA